MNNDDFNQNTPPALTSEREARVIAWIFGEASPFEAAELERLCAAQPELADFKHRFETIHGLLGEATKVVDPTLRLSPERRTQVLAVIGVPGDAPVTKVVAANFVSPANAAARAKRFAWREWALPMAACLALVVGLAGILLPTVGQAGFVAKKSKRPDPSSTILGPADSTVFSSRGDLVINNAVRVASGSGGTLANKSAAQAATLSVSAPPTVVFRGQSLSVAGEKNESAMSLEDTRDQMKALHQVEVPIGGAIVSGTLRSAPAAVRERKRQLVTITAGTPQEFEIREDNAESRFEDQLKRDEQRLATALNADMAKQLSGASSSATHNGSFYSDAPPSPPASADLFAPPASILAKDADAVGKLIATGRAQYLAGHVDVAQQTFEMIKAAEPENAQAQVFLGRILNEKAQLEELNRLKTRAQMAVEVSSSWQRPGVSTGGKSQLDTVRLPMAPVVMEKLSHAVDALNEDVDVRLQGFFEQAGVKFSTIEGSRIHYDDGYLVVIQTTRNIERVRTVLNRYQGPFEQVTEIDKLRAEIPTATEAVSTFSLHVSDASFRLAKAALAGGQPPNPISIRPEEFYNAFDYGDPAPGPGEPVACRVEQAAHPFLQQRNLVRIALRVPAAGRGASQPLRLTVLLDTSGSMEREDRAATLRAALVSLTSLLGPDDRVTLVGFARQPRLLAESLPGDQAAKLVEIAARTPAEGGTNLEEALVLAGELAQRQKLARAQNRIVLLTDGAANLGNADPQRLSQRIEALRQAGIAFDACGVVADGLDDTILEALTRKGDGRYTVLNSPDDADASFARQLAGAFRPAAKDVKVQVRFNPARVARYRLIGFEQHRLKTEDFRNDAVDAAELAAEEAAVALYQVEVLPEGEGELGEVFVRFLDTATNQRVERSWPLAYVAQVPAFARATPSLQLAGASAFLAESLRGGALAGQIHLEEFSPVVEGLATRYPQAPRVQEFITMFRQARRLKGE